MGYRLHPVIHWNAVLHSDSYDHKKSPQSYCFSSIYANSVCFSILSLGYKGTMRMRHTYYRQSINLRLVLQLVLCIRNILLPFAQQTDTTIRRFCFFYVILQSD